MRSRSQAATDVGRKRQNNEDNFFADDSFGIYAVADGVGGNAAGEVASQIFVDAVKAAGGRYKALIVEAKDRPDAMREQFLGFITDVFQQASQAMFARSQIDPETAGMASTGVILCLLDGNAAIGHVGDSRAYLIRGGKARQLTTDHTVAQELIDNGTLDPKNLATFPFKNVLSRSLGKLPKVAVDTLWLDSRLGDRFVLCTDGLYQYFDADTMGKLCQTDVASVIAAANIAGGSDNVTAVLIDVSGSPTRQFAVGMDERISALSELFMFRELTPQELFKTLKIVHEHSCAAGEPLVREGEPGDRFYVVIEGKLDVVKGGVTLVELRPGDHVGEIAFMDAQPRSATVIAREPSSVISIRRDDFLAITREDPVLATKLLRSFVMTLSGRLRHLSDDFVKLR